MSTGDGVAGFLQQIVKDLIERKITVNFHKENLIFNSGPNLTSKLMLQIVGTYGEFERGNIKERQKGGIEAAKKKGIRFGRKPVVDDEKLSQIITLLNDGMNKKGNALKVGILRQTS